MDIKISFETELENADREIFYFLESYYNKEVKKELEKLKTEADASREEKKKILKEISAKLNSLLGKLLNAEQTIDQLCEVTSSINKAGERAYVNNYHKEVKHYDESHGVKESPDSNTGEE